jgi:hypothetical protein
MTSKSVRVHKRAAIDVRKLGKLIRLLSTDQDGELVATVAAMGRVLLAADKGFGDLADAMIAGFSTKQQILTNWAPPAPDRDYWESMAWWAHYHRQHLSMADKDYVAGTLMGRNFDCGRADASMMARLRGIVAKISTARDADER